MKKQWKKMGILFATAVTLMILSGCTRNNGDAVLTIEPGQTDLEYVQSKGTLVVGITDFAPMDYREGEAWAGFDANLAEAFAESIGVTVEFVEIDWDKKTELIEKGSIDCIWNGMTRTKELQCERLFSHTRPDGSSFATALKEQNVSYRSAGENIAWGQQTPKEVVTAWMNSSGHRANIMNPNFTTIGVGYYENERGTDYWCQLFTR